MQTDSNEGAAERMVELEKTIQASNMRRMNEAAIAIMQLAAALDIPEDETLMLGLTLVGSIVAKSADRGAKLAAAFAVKLHARN